MNRDIKVNILNEKFDPENSYKYLVAYNYMGPDGDTTEVYYVGEDDLNYENIIHALELYVDFIKKDIRNSKVTIYIMDNYRNKEDFEKLDYPDFVEAEEVNDARVGEDSILLRYEQNIKNPIVIDFYELGANPSYRKGDGKLYRRPKDELLISFPAQVGSDEEQFLLIDLISEEIQEEFGFYESDIGIDITSYFPKKRTIKIS